MARATEGATNMGSTLRKKAIALAAAFALAASLVPASMAFAAGDESSEGGSWFDGVAEFFSPVVTFFTGDDASNDGIETYAAGEQSVVVDADSTNSWQSILQGETPSTKNIGRIWTDKTVLSNDYALEGALTGESVAKGDSDFLVGLSALASTSNLKTTTTTTEPLDIVLVLDESGSMANSFGGGWIESYVEVNSRDVEISTGHTYTDTYQDWWYPWDEHEYQHAEQLTYGGEYYALVDGEYVRIQEVTNRVYGERNTSYL